MISAIDNSKNQFYQPVNAVNFQADRSYSNAFMQDLQRQNNLQTNPAFGKLLTYGRNKNESILNISQGFDLTHPNVKTKYTAQQFDFIA